MSVKMNDFLLEYWRRRIMRDMPVEQYARLCDYIEKDDLVGHMKEWTDLLEKNGAGEYIRVNGLIQKKPMPDGEDGDWKMEEDEWKKLFQAFQTAFQDMDASKKGFKYEKKANDFLEKYFGSTGQLFSYAIATSEAEREIDDLKQILESHATELQAVLKDFFNDDFTWDDLLDGIRDKKYNKEPKFRDKLQAIAREIGTSASYYKDSPIHQIIGRSVTFNNIENGFDGQKPSPAKLAEFKIVYSSIMDTLYRNEKTIYQYFKGNGQSKICKTLEEAKTRLNYNDKDADEYLPPKRSDELSFVQKVQDMWNDTYSEYLEKYTKLQGDRLFFSAYAKDIFKAIDKEKIKPTDGLAKILEKSDAIKKRLQTGKKATKHFDWFTKTLKDLQSDPQLSKAFEGALTHGNQTRRIVEEIIIRAVQEGKIDEAKSTLEILSVMQYGLTTSKVMDAIGKTDFVMLSDGNLSWNKNEGMKMVTGAMDKAIKGLCMGVGYGFTIVGNAIRLSGGAFNGKMGNTLTDARRQKLGEYDAERAGVQASIDKNNQDILDAEADITASGIADEAEHDARRDALRTSRQGVEADEKRHKKLDDWLNNHGQEKQQRLLENRLDEAQQQYNQIQGEVVRVRADIANLSGRGALTPDEQAYLDYLQNTHLDDLNNQLAEADALVNRRQNTLNNFSDRVTHNVFTTRRDDLRTNIDTRITGNTAEEERLNKWRHGTETVKNLTDMREASVAKLNSWDADHVDQYRELMAYWDFLQQGRRTHTGPMYSWTLGSKKLKQKAFDAQKAAMFDSFKSGYTIS